jgi:hypothetical protein
VGFDFVHNFCLQHFSLFYICGSVHHQSILLSNQRDAAVSSRIYSSLQGYSTMFRVLSAHIIRNTIKTADAIIGTVHVSVWFTSVERYPRSGVFFFFTGCFIALRCTMFK